MKKRNRKIIILIITIIVSFYASISFIHSRNSGDLFSPSSSFREVKHLSDYETSLKGTKADAPVFVFDSGYDGATVLIASGAHPNESGAILASIFMMENIALERGRILFLPVMNLSAYSETLPGFAYPESYSIGDREFKVGSRNTSELDHWPHPPIYKHYPDGLSLSSEESGNINRAFPGRKNGSLTERGAYAIMTLLREEDVTFAFDMHEASLTYPVNLTIVTAEKNYDDAYLASLMLQEEGINMRSELSRESNAGYSHFEWNKIDGLSAFLIEVPTPFIDRTPGAMRPSLITEGKDEFLYKVAKMGYSSISYPEEGISISERVAILSSTVKAILEVSEMMGKEGIKYTLPSYNEIISNGIGYYLKALDNKDGVLCIK